MSRILLSLVFVLCVSEAALAEELRLSSEKSTFLPYEPIYVAVTYTGDQPILPTLSSGDITLNMTVVPSGESHTYQPMIRVCRKCIPGHENDAPVLHTTTHVLSVAAHRPGWFVPAPGVYTLQVNTVAQDLHSNIITITVRPPVSVADKAAMEILGRTPAMPAFQHLQGGDMFADALAAAKLLATGNSSYRPAMRDLLVKAYSQMSYSSDKVRREPDLDSAMHYYDPVTVSSSTPLAKASTLLLLNRRLKGLGLSSSNHNIRRELAALRALSSPIDLTTLANAARWLTD